MRARQHQPPFVLLQAARSATCAWPVARMQTEISDASRLVETASREPLGMSLTLLTISSPRPGPDDARQQIGQALARAFDARRHDARGDHRRFEQARDNPWRNRTLRARLVMSARARRDRRWSAAAPARR